MKNWLSGPQARETINPYRNTAGLVYQVLSRMRWDLDPQSWVSRRSLCRLKDSRRGQKAVILCNGPSLNSVDLDVLEGVYTFGLNKINLMFSRSPFRPSCIVAVNKLVIDQNIGYFKSADLPLFLDSYAKRKVGSQDNVVYLHSYGQQKFARDCSVSINQGATVTFVALQLAFHMGFSDVALVGCDHSFSSKGVENSTVKSSDHDPDHFDPNYFSGGVKWQLPDLFQSEMYYKLAQDVFSGDGRRVVNCTVGGNLDVFPRADLLDFLGGG